MGALEARYRRTNAALPQLIVSLANMYDAPLALFVVSSGLTTFWQAMLSASRCLNTAIGALATHAETGKLKEWMVKNVAIATGQVANAIVSERPACLPLTETKLVCYCLIALVVERQGKLFVCWFVLVVVVVVGRGVGILS